MILVGVGQYPLILEQGQQALMFQARELSRFFALLIVIVTAYKVATMILK